MADSCQCMAKPIQYCKAKKLKIKEFSSPEYGSVLLSQTNKQTNKQATPVAQFHKNKQANQKMGQGTKQTFLQRRHTDG